MKLKCKSHNRRVHVIEGQVFHRDSEKCDALLVQIGDNVYSKDARDFHPTGFKEEIDLNALSIGFEDFAKKFGYASEQIKQTFKPLKGYEENLKKAIQGIRPNHVVADELVDFMKERNGNWMPDEPEELITP